MRVPGTLRQAPYGSGNSWSRMFRFGLAALVFTSLMPLSLQAATITVKPGETLSDLADRYGISVGTLMRMNGMRNGNYLEAGSRLTVPGPEAGSGRHRVAPGDSLSGIASRYRISTRDLISVNNLGNADHVEVGQVLKLPTTATQPKQPGFKPVAVTPIPGATEHTVAKGQTLTQIAKAYQVPVASLININQLGDPNKVEVGTTLYLRQPTSTSSSAALQSQSVSVSEPSSGPTTTTTRVAVTTRPTSTATPTRQQPKPKPQASKPEVVRVKPAKTPEQVIAKSADWRTYGPLQVDWANWQTMGGSEVAPTLNAQGQALYLAVNCSAGKLNATGADGNWKQWSGPKSSFEKDLLKDRCQAKA